MLRVQSSSLAALGPWPEGPPGWGAVLLHARPTPLAWRGWRRDASPQPEAVAEVVLGKGRSPERGGRVEKEAGLIAVSQVLDPGCGGWLRASEGGS